jgi:hypothetical protein
MLCAALAFASWWTSHTILDTARTRRATDAVLENATVRHFVAGKIASATATAVGTPVLAKTAAPDPSALENQIDGVLARPDVRARLEQFVVDAHAELIGRSSAPAVLDRATVVTIVRAAVPNLPPPDLAKLHAVTFHVPNVSVLAASRNTLANRFWLYFVGAVVLVAIAIAASTDRRATVKLAGAWLLGISVMHLLVLWVVPVLIVPQVTDNPWAGLVTSLARALNGGIVAGLVVLAAAGAGFMLADRFIAPGSVPAPADQ